MPEFGAGAILDVQLDESSIARAEREIEQRLGDASVSVNARSMAPDGSGATGTARGQRAGVLDASRQQLDVQQGLADLAETRNEHLEDIADALEGGVGGGGGGGMGFLSGFGLRSLAGSVGGGVAGGLGLAGLTSLSVSTLTVTAGTVTLAVGFSAVMEELTGAGGAVADAAVELQNALTARGIDPGDPNRNMGPTSFRGADISGLDPGLQQLLLQGGDGLLQRHAPTSARNALEQQLRSVPTVQALQFEQVVDRLQNAPPWLQNMSDAIAKLRTAGGDGRGDDPSVGTQPDTGALQGPAVSFTVQNDIRSEDTGLSRDEVRRIRRIAKAEAKAMRERLERQITSSGAGSSGSDISNPIQR